MHKKAVLDLILGFFVLPLGMNMERLYKTVMLDLTSELTKLEDELERTINGKLSLDEKVTKCKSILHQMTVRESSIAKFTSMFSKPTTENNNNNNEQN